MMVLFTNCELGLGEAVDTTAPTISIKYPPAASTIRGKFILAGDCDDDKHVTSVKVTLQETCCKYSVAGKRKLIKRRRIFCTRYCKR